MKRNLYLSHSCLLAEGKWMQRNLRLSLVRLLAAGEADEAQHVRVPANFEPLAPFGCR